MAKTLEEMILEQVGSWTMHGESLHNSEKFWPVITISRSYGSRGAELGRVLGEKTGFSVWNKSLLTAISEESGADKQLMKSLDERIRTYFNDAVKGILLGSQHTNLHYFRSLVKVVNMIAYHGSSIIVGRGANYMIKDQSSLLRVRVVCPLEKRIENFAKRNDITVSQARKVVLRRSAERQEFSKYHFKKDITQAAEYDIAMNSDTYDMEQMASLVLDAYELKIGHRPYHILQEEDK